MKNLKYKIVYTDQDNVINVNSLTKENKTNHTYYIVGIDKNTGKNVKIPVLPVICNGTKSNYFRTFPDTVNNYYIDHKSYSMSLLHKLAQDLFVSHSISKIIIPNTIFQYNGIKLEIRPQKEVDIKQATKEVCKQIDNSEIRYDLKIVTTTDKILYIEMCVEHPLDFEKKAKIRKLRDNVIEVFINRNDFNIDSDTLEQDLIAYLSRLDLNGCWANYSYIQSWNEWITGIFENHTAPALFGTSKYITYLTEKNLKLCYYKKNVIKSNKTGRIYIKGNMCDICPYKITRYISELAGDNQTGTIYCNKNGNRFTKEFEKFV